MYKLLKNFFSPALALIVLTSIVQTGCKKKDVYPGQTLPKITAVAPGSGVPGVSVLIKGENLKNVTAVKFGTVEASGFDLSSVTDTSLMVQVPSMDSGKVFVQVYYGDGVGYNAAPFNVLLKPDITSVLPTTGFPGDMVTISGVNLDIVSEVKFGSKPAASFTATKTKIQVSIPAEAEGGDQLITVTSASTGGVDTASFNVNITPQVFSIAPASAVAGDVITVTGARFTGATEVKLGTTPVTYTVVSATEITFTVPAGASSGAVTITTPTGTVTSSISLTILVPGLAFPIYDEGLSGNWNGWLGGGWGGTKELSNTTPVHNGSFSCKIDYAGGWGSPLQLGGATIPFGSYTTFKISIYGGTGTTGKKIKIVFNEAGGYELTLGTEGQWNDYAISISNITSATSLTAIWLQEFTGTDYTIYVDDMGLN
ncbi:MAG: IPT/TIG domain-containing protein [Bacteroidota bacterium]